jgi:hypothetical protein
MSESVRQSNLFAAENYQKIFKAFAFIDYTAYDFDTLKQALINYIQTYYPEDFNDYIESSEFIAIIELLAYFGTSLAFRTDLNSRENFIDTAERRESIIRLAQMVNYVPRRNIPASGLFKIAAIQTNQPLTDANGININDTAIFWNDPNNPDWFDQFVQVCNAAFSTINPFGRPTKSGTIGSIPTDLYQLNSVPRLNVTYPTSVTVSGQEYPIDVCNPDFVTNETIFERDPDPANAFNFIYRNDSLGVSSANTGFFLYFKQGNLINVDTNFEFPVPNRLFPIDIQNINQDDVYVQETSEDGTVINKWLKVPALAGENIIYNSIQFAERNIFDVISGANNTVSVRFADGNFGNIPTGLFRFWIRVSANQALVIRPDDAQGLQINIPYIGADQQEYVLRIVFNLEQTIGNAAAAETDEQIRLRAPEVFSTQSRMVNGSDYNVLPLVFGNQIAKIQAIDRTYSGQSRYIDLNDPTGFHHDLIIFGQDGALYRDNQNVLVEVIENSSNSGTIENILINTIQEMLREPQVSQFFYDEYLPQFENEIRVNKQIPSDDGYSLLQLGNIGMPSSALVNPYQEPLIWKTSPQKFKNDTGYFSNSPVLTIAAALVNTLTSSNPFTANGNTYQPWELITSDSIVSMGNISTPATITSVAVRSVIQNGIPLIINPLNPYANIGPVELGTEQQLNYQAAKIFPKFRNNLNPAEIAEIVTAIDNGISFWLYYDLLTDEWHISTIATPGLTDQSAQPFKYAPASIVASYTSAPITAISGTVITVPSTTGLNVGDAIQTLAGTGGLFNSNTYVVSKTSTTLTVSQAPVIPLIPLTTKIVAGTAQIYSNWSPYPASGLLYVSIASNNELGITTFDLTARGRVYVFESYRDVRFFWEPGQTVIDNSTGQALQDTIEIMPFVNTNSLVNNNLPPDPILNPQDVFLRKQIPFNITGVFTQVDGYVDTSKVEVSMIDANGDGISDNPDGFNQIVAPEDRIVFEYYNNEVTGYQSTRPWITNWSTTLENITTDLYVYFPVDLTDNTQLFSPPFISSVVLPGGTGAGSQYDPPPATTVYMNSADLIFVNNLTQIKFNSVTPATRSIANQITAFFNGPTPAQLADFPWLAGTDTVVDKADILTNYFLSKTFLIAGISPPGFGVYYSIDIGTSANLVTYPTGQTFVASIDKYHFDKNGKVFTQNTTVPEDNRLPLYFKWSHYSPIDQRVDPAPTNIIDMIVITDSFYRDMLIWKNSNGTLLSLPPPPTTEELRIQFQSLNQYKMVSDSMIWNSGSFKILFGSQAAPELQATIKVVKAPSTSISDNEVKTKVIQAIDIYFDIRNWDFGEKFFWSELSAFIHQQLSRIISSVVIVPNNANSQFGNLFEIVAGPTELFISTATVNNVQIVSNLTDANLRV